MDSLKQNELALRQRGERADRIVAIGAFVAFLATGFVGEEPAPREPGSARNVQHAASVAAARR